MSISVVSRKNTRTLNEREREDYRARKEEFVNWLEKMGKDPEKREGYAESQSRSPATGWVTSSGGCRTTAATTPP